MDKVFEPSELELWDAQGDPNQAIEIQGKIKELLQANRQRQQPLLAEIAGRGAWALPGVINATYVWMSEMEVQQTQTMLAGLMADLARGNPAATNLLFRAGILETPFPVPRAICRRALEALNWQPDERQTARLRQEIALASKIGDAQTVLDIYGLLLRTSSQTDLTGARNQCIEWVREKRAEAGALLKLLINHAPSQVVPIVSAVFAVTISDRQDKNLANILLQPLRPIQPEWLENGTILNISREVLPQSPTGRLTVVEYLWIDAAIDCRKKEPERWAAIMPTVSEQLVGETSVDIVRYWFTAVGQVGEVDYIVQQSRTTAEPFGTVAASQLFFLSNRWEQARRGIADLKRENPGRHNAAEALYDSIDSGRGKVEGEIRHRRKPGEITTRRS